MPAVTENICMHTEISPKKSIRKSGTAGQCKKTIPMHTETPISAEDHVKCIMKQTHLEPYHVTDVQQLKQQNKL